MSEEEFTIQCGWCHREIISFVQPPAMVTIQTLAPGLDGNFWRICLGCYGDLLKLIATRDWQSTAPDRDPPRPGTLEFEIENP